MKNGQNLKLGDVLGTPPRNIQEVQASKLADAQGIPSSSIKSTRSFFNQLYFYCFMHYVLFLERLSFSCVFTVFNKVGPHHIFFGERHAPLGIPSSSIKSTRSFFNQLYFYCFMHYVLFLERLSFSCVF